MFYGLKRLGFVLFWGFAVMGMAVTGLLAQSAAEEEHLAIENPAELSKDGAERIYASLQRRMERGYAAAQLDFLINYQYWPRFNDAPYISATHGQRFVNVYANRMATTYGTLEKGQVLPAGSVLAKDSMTVTDEGRVFPGAFFIMQKLAAGTSPDTGDWRYVMVMPDGSVFGDSIGTRASAVAYCHACHKDAADRDYTFFVPPEYAVID